MTNYRKILELYSKGYSQRSIETSVRSSHQTVRSALDKAHEMNISWPLEDDVTNEVLDELFYGKRCSNSSPYAVIDYAYIHRELSKKGVTLTLLWQEYCERAYANGETPYMSTQFGDKYRRWARITKATMRVTHKPGDVMQVDWAGGTIPYYDSVTGEEYKAYLFVAALPCSSYLYVEACTDMKQENWLMCHVHAYEYFDGVTRVLVPDNLRTGVTANTRYETQLNGNRQIFRILNKLRPAGSFRLGAWLFIVALKFHYLINISYHVLVLYLCSLQSDRFQKFHKCICLFVLIRFSLKRVIALGAGKTRLMFHSISVFLSLICMDHSLCDLKPERCMTVIAFVKYFFHFSPSMAIVSFLQALRTALSDIFLCLIRLPALSILSNTALHCSLPRLPCC